MEIGEIVKQNCKNCGTETSMRYDGGIVKKGDTTERIYNEYKNFGQYTCLTCRGSFSFEDFLGEERERLEAEANASKFPH